MAAALIVVSAPSGAGKTTIAREMLRHFPALRFSISATTRPRRAGEEEGRDYYFLTQEEFERRVAAGLFVEWEEMFGHLYGTPASEIERARHDSAHLLFDVDVKGGLSIKRRFPEALLIFVRPPSLEILYDRLRNRHTEDEEAIAIRMKRVPMELALGDEFDHQVVNDNLARAIREVQTIVDHHLRKNAARRAGDATATHQS